MDSAKDSDLQEGCAACLHPCPAGTSSTVLGATCFRGRPLELERAAAEGRTTAVQNERYGGQQQGAAVDHPAAGCLRKVTAWPPVTSGTARAAPHQQLGKHLWFADCSLEAAYQAEMNKQESTQGIQWVVLRALIWTFAAAKLARGGSGGAAALMAAASVVPAAAQLAATTRWWRPLSRKQALIVTLAHLTGDVAAFTLSWRLYTQAAVAARAEAGGAAALWPLRHHLQFPCHAAAYLAVTTLRSGGTFLSRLVCATALLLAELCATRSMWGALAAAHPAPAAPGGGAALAAAQLAAVALLSSAHCLPLCAVYRREAAQRLAFARRRGCAVDASLVDPTWDSLSFTLPALAQALSVWSYLG